MPECLDAVALREFRHGTLDDDARSDEIAEHLAQCAACQQQFAAIPDQPLIQWLLERVVQPDLTPLRPCDQRAENWDGCPPPPALANHARWQCLRLLGKGGIGAAYLARQRQFPDRMRAIKVLQPQNRSDSHLAERFRREMLVTLDELPAHENIVRGYDAEVIDSYLLLIMEYVRGDNLEKIASRQVQGRLPYPLACGYMLQALTGLSQAARCGVVHRDLKPSNLMLADDGVVKILDFGLAKVLNGSDAGLTSYGVEFCGTAKYCSPEQAHDFARADVRSDLYSLGCTLYRLIAGAPPFGEHTGQTTALAVFQAHTLDTPRPLTDICPQVPRELSGVVNKLLAKDPAERHQSPEEALAALLPFSAVGHQQRYASASPEPPAPVEVFDLSPVKDQRGTLSLWTIGGVALTIVVVVATWQFAGSRQRLDAPETRTKPQPPVVPAAADPPTSRAATVLRSSGGSWQLDGGELIGASSGDEWLLFGNPAWNDYTFTCELKKDSGQGQLSLVFRSSSDREGSLFTLGAQTNEVRRLEQFDSGPASLRVLEESPDPESLKPDHWHDVQIVVRGSRVQCSVDGIKKFDVSDVAAAQGRVGLRVDRLSARFRNLLITDPKGKTLWRGLPELRVGPRPQEVAGAQPMAAKQAPPDAPTATASTQPEIKVSEDDDPRFFGSASWTDYDLTAKFLQQPPHGEVQFFVAAADPDNAVAVTLGALGNNRHEIVGINDGKRTRDGPSLPGQVQAGWHEVRIQVHSESITCDLDGRMVGVLDRPHRSTGKVGIGVGSSSATFRALHVASADGELLWQQE